MKAVNPNDLISAIPVMTRQQRLQRWSALIRNAHPVALVHGLEFMPARMLEQAAHPQTPFGIAAGDPTFKAMGLGNSIYEAMRFFGLSVAQLHEFSCDCGGYISNEMMAQRIEGLAG